jgi:hypothetical protein
MSGIVAAAQSAGCCCRPVEGCTCGDPNRPGSVFDRQLTAIAVTGEVTVDHAFRRNGSPYTGCGCDCFSVGTTYGTGAVRYGYRSPGAITDPDGLEPSDPCYPGCVNGGCGGCPTYSVSANTTTVICTQAVPGVASWASEIRTFGDNFVGAWSWQGRRVGHCIGTQGVRVRSCCAFLGEADGTTTLASLPSDLIVDSCGAFIDPETGVYVQTAYGASLGRLHMVQYARLDASGFTVPNQCGYTVRLGVTWAFTWEILKALSEDGVWPSPNAPALDGYHADYFKPCLSPSDTVLGRYEIGDVPLYDRSSVDQECGAIRAFEDLRVTFPNEVIVS